MIAPPKYTKVASEYLAEQEIDFEEVGSGSASQTPVSSEPTPSEPIPNETASAAAKKVLVPIRGSSAGDVRAYIVYLLIHRHNITSKAAHAAAGKWRLGRGFDFLEASSEDFNKIFGVDLGRHIYRSTVHDELLRWNTSEIKQGFLSIFTRLDK